ncbi:hypothetical protein PARMER_02442 [Parabacteroides merdae ATCC 43184]|nr:hypothetical protein PARMER_02442 [Parabacteroides merdae ATCC 43184]
MFDFLPKGLQALVYLLIRCFQKGWNISFLSMLAGVGLSSYPLFPLASHFNR